MVYHYLPRRGVKVPQLAKNSPQWLKRALRGADGADLYGIRLAGREGGCPPNFYLLLPIHSTGI